MGLLWPGLFDRFGDVIGLPFALEGIFFFLEAIFISIYIFGWKRLSPWAHFWSGVPIPIVGLLGRPDGGGGQLVDEPARGLHHGLLRHRHRRRRLVGDLQRRRQVRVPAHVLRRPRGGRVPRRLALCGGDAARPARPLPPQGLPAPVHDRGDRHPDPDGDRRLHRAVDLQRPADQVRGAGAQHDHRLGQARDPPRAPERGRDRQRRPRDPRAGLVPERSRHRHEHGRAGPRLGAARGPAPGAGRQHRPPRLGPDGGPRHRAHPAGAVVRLGLLAPARPARRHALVPARGGRRPRGRLHLRGVGLDRHRGRAPAVGRLRDPADRGRGDQHGRGRRVDLADRRDRACTPPSPSGRSWSSAA